MSSAALQPEQPHEVGEVLSYADQRLVLGNAEEMAFLRSRLADLDKRPPAPVLTTEEFFAAFPD